jgi:hypothetical protein
MPATRPVENCPDQPAMTGVGCKAQPASRQGRRASLGIHGPNRTAAPIRYAVGDSAPTLRVGPHPTRGVTRTAGPWDDSCPQPVSGAVVV